jgi:hypothetical protein
MATTYGKIVEDVARKLAGYTLRQDRQATLVTAINSSTLSVTISNAANISAGIIQIDDELLYVESFDRNTAKLTIAPYGRGYNGTTAASHTANSRVVISPTFPNVDIKTTINETIQAVFPDLYATNYYTFAYSPAKTTYALPSDTFRVIAVSYQSIGPSKEWVPVRQWRTDSSANTETFGTSNTISLYGLIPPGRTVQVFYGAEPGELENNTDDFNSTTGLPDSCKDVITLGATAKLIAFIDPARLTFGSAEADQQSQIAGRSYGAGTASAKYLYSLYQQRLQEEANKLDARYNIRVHFTR